MIYLEPASLGWAPLVESWINTLPDIIKDERKYITGLFQWAVPPCLRFLRKSCKVCLHNAFFNEHCLDYDILLAFRLTQTSKARFYF